MEKSTVTKYRKALLSSVFFLMLVLPACGSQPSEEPTEAADTETTAPEASATPEPVEPTKKPTKTPPQTGPLATAAALAGQTTLVPPTPLAGIEFGDVADDDYVSIFKIAWAQVEANYLRDDFNGVDWNAVYDEYLPLAEQVKSSEELWALLSDMMQELNDNHSHFIYPGQMGTVDDFEESIHPDMNPWSGVFIIHTRVGREFENLMVWCVSPGSEAENAGIKRGDHILAVDGVALPADTSEITRDQLRQVLFGSGGDTVKLTIQQGPDSEPTDFTIALDKVPRCDYDHYEIVNENPKIGYFRLQTFLEGDLKERMLTAIQEMESDGELDGLIIDVRHNRGGFGDVTDEVLGLFTQGTVGTEGSLREGATRSVYRIRGPVEWNESTPIVVLTDGESNSSADYFSIIIQFLGRAVIIGMNSAGNIDGWTSYALPDTSQLGIASSTLILEDGRDLEGIGATPDIEVPLGDWGLSQSPFDVQLQAAIDYLIDLLAG
jgi:C-terminal peptidase prc